MEMMLDIGTRIGKTAKAQSWISSNKIQEYLNLPVSATTIRPKTYWLQIALLS